MTSKKLNAGDEFPVMELPTLSGRSVRLGEPGDAFKWQLVIIYRGKHCSLCTRYLKEFNEAITELRDLGIELVAASADSQEKANAHNTEIEANYDIAFDLSIEKMQQLGLYISAPRSPQETEKPFAEPGLFLINPQGKLQVVDISNAPFARPAVSSLIMGFKFILNLDNQYPIRGTH